MSWLAFVPPAGTRSVTIGVLVTSCTGMESLCSGLLAPLGSHVVTAYPDASSAFWSS